jgi:hypothetical protein
MGFMICEIDTDCTFSSALTVDALSQALPPEAITRVIAHHGVGEARQRCLTMVVVVWLVIALHLYPTVSIGGVLRKLARGLRFIWSDPSIRLPSDSAIAYRRSQLAPVLSSPCSSSSVSLSPRRRPVVHFCSACARWHH